MTTRPGHRAGAFIMSCAQGPSGASPCPKMEGPVEIDTISDMATLRAHIDSLDEQLIDLLAQRHALIDQAARIKKRIGLPARLDDRVEEVVANAGRHAASRGLDPALIAHIWRQLVEAAIAQEDRHLNGE